MGSGFYQGWVKERSDHWLFHVYQWDFWLATFRFALRISASVHHNRECMNSFCLVEQLVNVAPPSHAYVRFLKRSRSEYTNIQHILVQQIAIICSIQVIQKKSIRQWMSGEGGNTTGFLQCDEAQWRTGEECREAKQIRRCE